jgi:uncharacterized protein YkwD
MDDGDRGYYRRRALKRLTMIAAVIIVVGGAAWYVAHLPNVHQDLSLVDASKNFSAPAPLIATSNPNRVVAQKSASNEYMLTRAGIIADTNAERAENGNLLPLAENATLDQIATLRLQDMFARQYFAHISPANASGATSSAITVANSLGYEYINLGENLALGNFAGDQGVVTAWMNSLGHRANILDKNYTQIGVAAGDGVFQGEEAWIAVQVFGRPMSACPTPDTDLQSEINADQAQIANMQAELQADKAQIDAAQSQGSTDSAAYSQEVSAYDALVNQYNALAAQAQATIAEYNAEVVAYNTCVGVSTSTSTATSTSSSTLDAAATSSQ